MRHEKIVKRENGVQYKIIVVAQATRYDKNIEYRVDAEYRNKGKRKWLDLQMDISGYDYGVMSFFKRCEYNQKNMLRFVTKEEIIATKMELWNKLKPNII